MDKLSFTWNCFAVGALAVVFGGFGCCLWKLQKQTAKTQEKKNSLDYQREGTCDVYGFQAEVFEVRKDRLLVNNVSILTNHTASETDGAALLSPMELERIWFPFSYPTLDAKKPMELIISLKQQEENSPVTKKEIRFRFWQ